MSANPKLTCSHLKPFFGFSIFIILALSTMSLYLFSLGVPWVQSRTVDAAASRHRLSADPSVTTGLVRTWGGPYYDSGKSVALDSSGSIIMAGESISFGVGAQNVIIVKYNPSGDILWEKTWGSTGSTTVAGAGLDSSGSVYVGGTNSTGGVFVVKFDSGGTFQWQKSWGSGSYLNGFAVDSAGNSYLTGSSGFIPFYVAHPAFIIKLDINGNLVWQKSWGGSSYDIGVGVAVDSGNVYVTGTTSSFPVRGSYQSVFILKLDSVGNLLWQKTWSGGGNDYSQAIAADPSSGNIYVYGYSSSSGGQSRGSLLKIDSSGNLIWQRAWLPIFFTGFGIGRLTSDPSGNIYATTQVFSLQTSSSQVALAKIAGSGNLLWQVAWGGNYDNDIPSGVAVDSAGNLVLTGEVLQPAPYSFTALNSPFLSASSSIFTPSGTFATLNSSVLTTPGTVTTPSGSSTYSGGGDAFILTVPSAGPANILKTASSISLSISSLQTIVTGGSVRVSGIISPPTNVTVTLTYIRPDGSSINRTVTSDTSGSFTDTFFPDKSGLWQVQASWGGNVQTNGAQSAPQSFQVQDAPSFLTANLPWFILAAVVAGFLVATGLTNQRGARPA